MFNYEIYSKSLPPPSIFEILLSEYSYYAREKVTEASSGSTRKMPSLETFYSLCFMFIFILLKQELVICLFCLLMIQI
jgi:hypothetical protein